MMTVHTGLRGRVKALFAAGTTAALLAGGLALAPSVAHADDAATPTVTSTSASRAGGKITVTGSGFNAESGSVGIYLGIGPAGLPGFYQGASQMGDMAWIAPGNASGGEGMERTEPMNADGTFSVQIEVPEYAEGSSFALYTSKAHGQGFSDPSQNTIAPVTYAQPSATASVSAAEPGMLSVKFDLANIPKTPYISESTGEERPWAGSYVSVYEEGTADDLSMDNMGAGSDWITASQFTDGAATRTVKIAASKLDRTKNYSIAVWNAHTLPSTGEVYAVDVPLEITENQWATVFADPIDTTATVSISGENTAKYNVAKTVKVTVKPAAGVDTTLVPTGKASIRIDDRSYSTTLKNGVASIKLTKPVSVGTQKVKVAYRTDNAAFADYTKEGAATLKVTKATPKVSIKLNKTKVKTSKNAKITVKTSVSGSLGAKASKSKVYIYDGSKRIKATKLNSSGKITAKLPKLKKGTHKIKVKVVGNSNLKTVNSSAKKLKAVK